MKNITIFDTTISSYNLGNEIIMESVYEVLYSLFEDDFFLKVPPMEIKKITRHYLRKSDHTFFGGTNAINNRMWLRKQWDINLFNLNSIRNTTLLGVGWWQYQKNKPDLYTRFILRKILSKKYIHSVRDNYTKEKLNSIGIENVINTGCPTLWKLTPEFCKNIRTNKSNKVIFTLTDYNKNKTRDTKMLQAISNNYNEIFFWPQGLGDLEYVKILNKDLNIKINLVAPNLKSYNQILENNTIDYIGTRLHAGIKSLQKKQKTIIVGIDNRAKEMNKDFNLPVIDEKDLDGLDKMIKENLKINITIPEENIKTWLNNFKK